VDQNKNTPYANLDPSLILDAIESVGYQCTGSLFALNSFENRVYQIGIEESAPVIVKFYRPHRWSNETILEEHAFSAELAEHEIPVIAPLAIANGATLHHFKDFRFAVFARQGGRALELDNLENLEWMGRFIGRLHAVGACKSFQHRMQLNPQTYGHDTFKFLNDNHFIPAAMQLNFAEIVTSALLKVDEIFHHVGKINVLRLHGDCHAGNVLWNDTGPRIVDLDDCLTGPAIQDIWMLLSGDTDEQVTLKLNRILEGYEEFYDFNYREIYLIEALRTLRLLHYCAWLAKRWEDPAFPLNFPWFNTPAYWQELLEDLREQDMLLDKVLLKLTLL